MNQSSGCDEAGRDDRLIDSWVTKESVPLFIVCYIDSPLWHFHYCRVDLYCLILKSLYFVYLSCLAWKGSQTQSRAGTAWQVPDWEILMTFGGKSTTQWETLDGYVRFRVVKQVINPLQFMWPLRSSIFSLSLSSASQIFHMEAAITRYKIAAPLKAIFVHCIPPLSISLLIDPKPTLWAPRQWIIQSYKTSQSNRHQRARS